MTLRARRAARSRCARASQRARSGASHSALLGRVGEIREHDEAEHDGRYAFEQEQPLPAREPVPAVELEHDARERTADDRRQRNRDHEPRHRARSVLRRIPVAEVIDDAGQEAGFGDAEQEAQHVEARSAPHEHHRDRQDAPRDHDARDPAARADAHEDQVARHLEQRVADEEDAGAEAVDGGAEAEVGVHLQRREADVDAVEPGDDVEQQQERQEPPPDLGQRRAAELRRGLARARRCVLHGGVRSIPTRMLGWSAADWEATRWRVRCVTSCSVAQPALCSRCPRPHTTAPARSISGARSATRSPR